MPNISLHTEILQFLNTTAITITLRQKEEISASLKSSDSDLPDEWSDTSCSSSRASMRSSMMIPPRSPHSPHSPMLSVSSMDIDSNSDSADTISTADLISAPYTQMLRVIESLCDDIEALWVLDQPEESMLKFPQLYILHRCAEHWPDQFRKKLRVNPLIFDDILDEISNHPIFQNQSNNRQLPIAIQFAVFLFRAGHYGNACTPDDVAQWAGISIGTVINCTHQVMAVILDQHNKFIYIPHVHSEDMCEVRKFAKSQSCHTWRNGVFAADGTTVNLHARPGIFSNGFYDWKSNFSLNCPLQSTPI